MYGDVQNACAPGASRLVAGPERAAPGDERHRPPSAQGFMPRSFRTRVSSLSPPILARAGPSAIPAR